MRTKDELYLIKIAQAVLNRMDLPAHAGALEHCLFYELIVETERNISFVGDFLFRMNHRNLGMLVGLGLNTDTDVKVSKFRHTKRHDTIIDTSIGRHSDNVFLVRLAQPVLIAAMYDIAATEWIISRIEQGPEVNRIDYYPKPAMRKFVIEQRRRSAKMFVVAEELESPDSEPAVCHRKK